MFFNFSDYVAAANTTTSVGELLNVFLPAMEGFGLDKMVLTLDTDHDHIGFKARVGIIDNFPKDFMNHYHENNFVNIDPVQIYARCNKRPFSWRDSVEKMQVTKKQKKIVDLCDEAKLYNGLYVPIARHGLHAGVAIASSANEKNLNLNMDLITAYCNHFYEVFTRLHEKQDKIYRAPVLTKKEVDVLTLAARGTKDFEIAEKLGLSIHTIETHMKHIYLKLQVPNRTAAVALALSNGMICLNRL